MPNTTNQLTDDSLGVTGEILSYLNSKSGTCGLFKPYKSGLDVYIRAASIITAPIKLSTASLAVAVQALTYFLDSITLLVMFKPTEAFEEFVNSLVLTFAAVSSAIFTILSPAVNAVDLIGSGFTTLCQGNGDQNEPAASPDVVTTAP